ncbi:MAG: ATP-dependent Clp protease adaptor ClpS [Bacteroidales bacterium]|nr:ATP-dependent Clp protease adaptor ClpS [Bacteroidales bacterium]
MNGSTKYQEDTLSQSEVLESDILVLWLINDDYNTFDFVIEVLMELCHHTYEQACQCAMITHTTGKCDIYRSYYEELKAIADKMLNLGLTVEITH